MSTLLSPAVLDAPRSGRHLPEPATLRTLLADLRLLVFPRHFG
jgi:hypothetical protein